MNHLNRQEQEVLAILKASGSTGMNSYQWRAKFVQLPARIFGLKAAGYAITTRRLKNGSVDYLLLGEPERKVEAAPAAYEWDFSTGTARRVLKGAAQPVKATKPTSAAQVSLFD